MMSAMKFIYDKASGKLVEKPQPDPPITMLVSPNLSEASRAYLEFMDDAYDIMAGREPRSGRTYKRSASND